MAARANRRRPRTASVKVAFGNDNENVNELTPEYFTDQTSPSDSTYHQAFFTIHNTTVEVVLNNDLLSWTTVTNESHSKTSQGSNTNTVDMHNVYAISPINSHWNWSLNVTENVVGTNVSTVNTITSTDPPPPPSSTLSQTSVLRGFQLHSYQITFDNILQEILIIFQSDDSNLLEQWFYLLAKIISRYKPARHIFVLLNPYSGGKHTRHTYATKIKTILDRLPYKISYAEIGDDNTADEAIQNFEDDFDSLDSVVILGGDGSVINVINALIRYLSKANRTRLDMENDLPTIPFPLCIIPEGTTNIISHTIHGNIDHCTPLFHLIFNQTMKIDMSAIFDQQSNFITSNFSAGTGYPTNVLKYFPRYCLHSPKTKIKKSFSKATLNKNLQPVEVEIRYIPATQNDVSVGRCCQGCPSCTPPMEEKSDDQVKAFDDSHLQNLSRLKRSSNQETNIRSFSGKRSFFQSNENEKNWKILHDEYLQVAVLTNANLWTYAPQGLAKFGHLADGLLDLIIIQPVARKEFLRYIKRNGNSKNQFDLPFTKLIKVKEIEIELKSIDNYFSQMSNNTDNQSQSTPSSDDSSNENMSDNESNYPKHQPHPPTAPMSEDTLRNAQRRRRINQTTQEHVLQPSKSMDATILHFKAKPQTETTSEIYGSTSSLRRSGIFQTLKNQKNKFKLPRTLSARGRDTDDEKQANKSQRSSKTTLRPARSLLNLLSNGKTDKDSASVGEGRQPSVLSRSSSLIENRKATKSSRTKRPCMWNLDFSPYNSPLIRIKCFYRYLSVYGVGVQSDTRMKEINYSCFGRMG